MDKDSYNIYIDRKDTKGFYKVRKLQNVLCNNIYDFKREGINMINEVSSHESELLQIVDLLIGAMAYYNRGYQNKSAAKSELIKRLQNKYNICLSESTDKTEKKFNIFIWEPKKC